ncbi:MAG: hypothetical protein KDB52_05295 [Solirubrobacterales bacterium]|nr:hypothetical protein [Solirubrobacterales bacterium]
MGFFKDMKKTYDMSQEMTKDWDPGAQAKDGVERMKQANAMMAEQAESMRLATEGVDASATIAAVQQGTAMVNFQPTVHIEMTVSREGMPPYPATATQVVPQVQLSMLEPGRSVCVKVAEDDPQKVWVDLSRPVP